MFIRKQGKYRDSKNNWILLMNIQMVCFWILFAGYFFIPVEMKRPLLFIMGGLIISFAVQVFGFHINPDLFKDKKPKEAN